MFNTRERAHVLLARIISPFFSFLTLFMHFELDSKGKLNIATKVSITWNCYWRDSLAFPTKCNQWKILEPNYIVCYLHRHPKREGERERGIVVCGIRMRLQISLKSTTFVSNCLSHGCILAFFRLTDYTSSSTQSSKENVILLKVFHLSREMK